MTPGIECPPPPCLYPESSAAFSNEITTFPDLWTGLELDEFTSRLLGECDDSISELRGLNSQFKRAMVIVFHPKWQDKDTALRPKSAAGLDFLEDSMVKLKRHLYGDDLARAPFDPRREGAQVDAFNRSTRFLQRVLARLEGQLPEPHFCPECGAFGDQSVIASHHASAGGCLSCEERYTPMWDYYTSLLVALGAERWRGFVKEIKDSSVASDQTEGDQTPHAPQPYQREDILALCFQALADPHWRGHWTRESTIIRQIARQRGASGFSRRAIRRELALHALNHPDRDKYVSRRMGRFLFEFQAPDRYRVLPDALSDPGTRRYIMAVAAPQQDDLKGIYELLADGRFVIRKTFGSPLSTGSLAELERFVRAKLSAGVVEVKPPGIYWVTQEGGRFRSSVLIGHVVPRASGAVGFAD